MRPVATARDVPGGNYRFLPGIAPFSSGVVALPGYQVVHVTLRAPIPWRDGFALIDRTSARRAGRAPRCAPSSSEARRRSASRARCVQRRLPRALLTEWKSFAYTPPGATPRPTLVVAGAGEMRERGVGVQGIVRHGETSPEAMREKARYVMGVMQARLSGLDVDWPDVTTVGVYTARPIETFLTNTVLRPAGAAATHEVRWFHAAPRLSGSTTRWIFGASSGSSSSRYMGGLDGLEPPLVRDIYTDVHKHIVAGGGRLARESIEELERAYTPRLGAKSVETLKNWWLTEIQPS